jgi:hypothetical protein
MNAETEPWLSVTGAIPTSYFFFIFGGILLLSQRFLGIGSGVLKRHWSPSTGYFVVRVACRDSVCGPAHFWLGGGDGAHLK